MDMEHIKKKDYLWETCGFHSSIAEDLGLLWGDAVSLD